MLLAGAGLGLLVTALFWRAGVMGFWRSALLHGFEGALVGGLCDWFAVWKTYSAVETKSAEVADGIGRWVSDELLSHHVVRKNLQEIFHDPEVKRAFYVALDGFVGSEEDVVTELTRLWVKVEPPLVEYVVAYELSADELGAAGGAFDDERILAAVGHCLGKALEDLGDSPELHAAVQAVLRNKGGITRLLANLFVDVGHECKEIGTRLRSNVLEETRDGSIGAAVAAATRRAAGSYVAAWNEMRPGQRREAAAALIEHLSRPIFAALAKLIVKERDRLRRLDRLIDHPRAKQMIEVLDRLVDERLSSHVGRFVAAALRSQTPQELRRRIEAQTGRYLQLIRVNGTALGFVIGLVIGAVMGKGGG